MLRITVVALMALALTHANAQTFEAHDIRVQPTVQKYYGAPIRLANGDLVLTETSHDETGTRHVRFSESGQWAGVMPRPGDAWPKPTPTGDFVGVSGVFFRSTCDIYALGPELQLKWRHRSTFPFDNDNELGGNCGTFVQDGDGRTWFRDADFDFGYLHRDGSIGPYLDVRDFSDPSGIVQTTALAAYPDRAGAVFAFTNVFDHSATELVSFGQDLAIAWRHPLARLQGEGLEVVAVHLAAGNDLRAIVRSHVAGANSSQLMLLRVDATGAALWTRRYPELPIGEFYASHRFADGAIGVLYSTRSVTDPFGYTFRVAVIGPDGDVQRSWNAGDEFIDAERLSQFVQLGDGSRWLVSNRDDEDDGIGVAWDLDGDGALHTLGVGLQTGVVMRSDGKALVFGDTLGQQALLLDGASNSQRVDFIANAPQMQSISLLSRKQLASGDDLLLWQKYGGQALLSRLDGQGLERWQHALPGNIGYNATPPHDRLLIADAQTGCVILEASLTCVDTDTGVTRFERTIPTNASISALASLGGIELVFVDEQQHLRHWRLSHANELLTERDLGRATLAYFVAGHVLARSTDGTNSLIESNIAQQAPSTRTVAVDSLLLSQNIAHRFDNGDYLVDSYQSLQFHRVAVDDNIVWTGTIEPHVSGGSYQVAAVHRSEDVIIYYADEVETYTRRLHFFSAATGVPSATSVSPGDGLGNEPIFAVDAIGDRISAVSSLAGTITVRSFDFLGTPLATASWRCRGTCVRREASVADGRVRILVEQYGPFTTSALTRLTLTDAAHARRAPHPDDGAISGVFVATNDTNRGYVIDWLPSARVLFVARFAGDTSDFTSRRRLDWETMQGVVTAGATAVTLPRYHNANGRFSAADDAPISSFGTATFRFDGCDAAELTLVEDSEAGPRSEVVYLQRSGPRLRECHLLDGTTVPAQASIAARGGFDARQSGAWVAAGANDQGILAAVLPATANANGVFFAPWFTYWPDAGSNNSTANRHWLTLQGTLTPASSGSVELGIFRATSGSHGDVRPSNTLRIGTATWTVVDCEHATLNYQFDHDESAHPYAGRSGAQNYARPGACSGGP